MVFEPRGAGKSTYCSCVGPTHVMGECPGTRILLTSHDAELAKRNGRKARNIVRQPRYQRLFNTELSKDSGAADRWQLTNGSEYAAFGMGGGAVGFRADGLVIDDPVKSRQAAKSEIERESTRTEYIDGLLGCLVPGGWVILVMTRWDAEDLAGGILPPDWNGESGMIECRDGKTWEVLCLQAKCETHSDPLGREIGEYLWPEWFEREHWVAFERNPITWNSQCQQRPRPIEGSFFTEAMLLEPTGLLDADGQPLYAPVAFPKMCDLVFATIDSANKTGVQHNGTGVVFWAWTSTPEGERKAVILDWDITQIEAASLKDWMPLVFRRLENLARICGARLGSVGAWIEDKASGTVLLQQAAHPENGWPAQAIDSKLTAMGKEERGLDVSKYVTAGDCRMAKYAYDKVVEYKEVTKNHLLGQILGFEMGLKDTTPTDLFDCFCYGLAISCGNRMGF